MALRTELMGLQYYDRDGGLDWFYCGSEWLVWRDSRLQSCSIDELKDQLRSKFEKLLQSAFHDIGWTILTSSTGPSVCR